MYPFPFKPDVLNWEMENRADLSRDLANRGQDPNKTLQNWDCTVCQNISYLQKSLHHLF